MNRREFKRFNTFKYERAELFNGMLKILGTNKKVYCWLDTENPHLGSARPIELIIAGREEKLINFIETMITSEVKDVD